MEATAIIKGTKNLEAAKTLADWSISSLKANGNVQRCLCCCWYAWCCKTS